MPFAVVHDRDAPAGRPPIATERDLNDRIARLAGADRVVVLEPDFEGVTRLRRHHHKPEQAWRRFAHLQPADVPEVLAQVVSLATGLAGGQREAARQQ